MDCAWTLCLSNVWYKKMTLTRDLIQSCTHHLPGPPKRGGLAFAAICGLSLAVGLACVAPAAAQDRLQAQWGATIAGIPVLDGTLNLEIQNDWFSIALSGATVGFVKFVNRASFTWLSQGRVTNGTLVATDYRSSTTTSKKTEEIHIAFANGNVKLSTIVPDPPIDPNRTPVTDAHRRGVLDPLTAWFVHVPGTGDVLTPDACHASTAVFNGHARYDLNLVFKRMETVTADKGYRGPVMVCAWHVFPVAGYTPEDIKQSAAQRNNEIAFAPINESRILVPFWIKESMPLGTLEIKATSFIAEPQAASRFR
jgi:hypothetical protein